MSDMLEKFSSYILSILNSPEPKTIWYLIFIWIISVLIKDIYTRVMDDRDGKKKTKREQFPIIMDLIKKIDDYCYWRYRDWELYKEEAWLWGSEDISDSIGKTYFLMELYFPKLINSCEEYNGFAYEYVNNCTKKESRENYNKRRDKFIEEIRRDAGL